MACGKFFLQDTASSTQAGKMAFKIFLNVLCKVESTDFTKLSFVVTTSRSHNNYSGTPISRTIIFSHLSITCTKICFPLSRHENCECVCFYCDLSAFIQHSPFQACTILCSVTWPLDGSEAGVDLALIQTSLLLFILCISSCSYAN